MSIDDAIENLEYEINEIKEQPISHDNSVSLKTLDIALRALEAQKKLAELRGMDICYWMEDYDYEDNNISEYEYEATVNDFLIDEAKEEKEVDVVKNFNKADVVEREKIEKAIEEIQKLRGCSCSCSDGIIDDVEDILDKLIESE